MTPERNSIPKVSSAWGAVWKCLSLSQVYILFGAVIGGDRFRRFYLKECLRPREGDKVLDIGCGPGEILDYLPDVDYTGFDFNEEYIVTAKKRYGDRGKFIHIAVEDETAGNYTGFDLVMGNGLLHHITDEEANNVFQIAFAALADNGRFVTLDGVFTDRQSGMARYFVSRDRGRYVRAEAEYVRLAREVFPNVKSRIIDGKLRIPYTHIVMECSK